MKYFLLVLLCSCGIFEAKSPGEYETIVAYKKACYAKGAAIISRDVARGEACTATALRLDILVATDEDCRVIYGDAGIAADLCEPPVRDGGSE